MVSNLRVDCRAQPHHRPRLHGSWICGADKSIFHRLCVCMCVCCIRLVANQYYNHYCCLYYYIKTIIICLFGWWFFFIFSLFLCSPVAVRELHFFEEFLSFRYILFSPLHFIVLLFRYDFFRLSFCVVLVYSLLFFSSVGLEARWLCEWAWACVWFCFFFSLFASNKIPIGTKNARTREHMYLCHAHTTQQEDQNQGGYVAALHIALAAKIDNSSECDTCACALPLCVPLPTIPWKWLH